MILVILLGFTHAFVSFSVIEGVISIIQLISLLIRSDVSMI